MRFFMKEKQHITIHIADVPPLDLQIKPQEEEQCRITEKRVNKLWSAWSKKFEDKSSKEILAMIAYQYAKIYDTLVAQVNSNEEGLVKAEKAIDDILLNFDSAESLS